MNPLRVFIVLISTLFFISIMLLMASRANGEWYHQLHPKYTSFETVEEFDIVFQGKDKGLIATFRMKNGSCADFKATVEKITHTRKCGTEQWADYIFYEHKGDSNE